jgi:hypothetical protein
LITAKPQLLCVIFCHPKLHVSGSWHNRSSWRWKLGRWHRRLCPCGLLYSFKLLASFSNSIATVDTFERNVLGL